MPITGTDPAGTRVPGARNMDAGLLLIGIGAIMLLVSLFLEWYEPNAEAWDVFEVWDLVLAALAIAALVAVAGRMGFGTPRPAELADRRVAGRARDRAVRADRPAAGRRGDLHERR